LNDPAEQSSRQGLLLIGHGTREAVGLEEFLATVQRVAQRVAPMPVEPAFLEFAQPTIAAGFAQLVQRGASHVIAVPVILFSAGHMQRDIPKALAAAVAGSPGARCVLAEHLGCHASLLELARLRYEEALRGHASVAPDRSALVVVGRGSHDAGATAEMLRFVELRRGATDAAIVQPAFVAMARPTLDDVLVELGGQGLDRIVVQPHLLFGGVLMDRIVATVERFATRFPGTQWICVGYLGPSPLLAEALLQRASESTEG